jgi:hypothetical protein
VGEKTPKFVRIWRRAATLLYAAMLACTLAGILTVSIRSEAARAPQFHRKHKTPPADAPLCQVNNLTTQMPQEFLPLRVVGNSLVAAQNSAGVLTLRNGFAQPIADVAVVWEYEDAKGAPLFNMAAETESLGPGQSWLVANFGPRDFSVVPRSAAVAPGATVSLGGTSALTLLACPAQAHVTLIHAEFDDGRKLDFAAPDWRLDPALLYATLPESAKMPPPAASLPASEFFRMDVDAEGRVTSVAPTMPWN